MTLDLDSNGADYTWTYDILATFGSAVERTATGGQTVIANPLSEREGGGEGHAYIGIKGPLTPPGTTTVSWSNGSCNGAAYAAVMLSP
jgi:hypothetical protein